MVDITYKRSIFVNCPSVVPIWCHICPIWRFFTFEFYGSLAFLKQKYKQKANAGNHALQLAFDWLRSVSLSAYLRADVGDASN